MDAKEKLTKLKLVMQTQVDWSYLSVLCSQIFDNPSSYSHLQGDMQFINQLGAQLFNYTASPDPVAQAIWFESLSNGLNRSINDAKTLMESAPQAPQSQDLAIVLTEFIADCQAIQACITVNKA